MAERSSRELRAPSLRPLEAGRPRRRSGVAAALLAVAVVACGRGAPPEPEIADPSTAALGAPFDAGTALALASSSAAATPVDPATPDGGPRAAPSAASVVDAGPEPGALPQTNDKPKASGAAFDARVAALWAAIVSDSPDDAMPFFFPVRAYEQVKAIGNPAGDWRRRLVAAFGRDLHKLHAKLGADPTKATFSRIEVPEERARWVEPGEEGNKLGYYRVYGTRIWYEVDGKQRSFDVTSLISWRGEWYVVHLAGFK